MQESPTKSLLVSAPSTSPPNEKRPKKQRKKMMEKSTGLENTRGKQKYLWAWQKFWIPCRSAQNWKLFTGEFKIAKDTYRNTQYIYSISWYILKDTYTEISLYGTQFSKEREHPSMGGGLYFISRQNGSKLCTAPLIGPKKPFIKKKIKKIIVYSIFGPLKNVTFCLFKAFSRVYQYCYI